MNRRYQRYEHIVYALVWVLLLAAPLLLESLEKETGSMGLQLFAQLAWRVIIVLLPFAIVFYLHNWLLAPLLVYRQRRGLYFVCVAMLVCLFMGYQCSQGPRGFEGPDGEPPALHQRPPRPPHGESEFSEPPEPPGPPMAVERHDIISTIILILMLGMNIGIKLYFKQRADAHRLEELEQQAVAQQLEYLRYQIRPHFLMNTLNNIHALIDIDPERAKTAILELSKLMRFMLYEGDKALVPVERELTFLSNYIILMQMRYTDRVRFDINIPAVAPSLMMPPLLLITFVENAFKHGISYRHDSFIEVKVVTEGTQLFFECKNSIPPAQPKTDNKGGDKGGVGLNNVRRRLDLLYPDGYTLRINSQPQTYEVQLSIPLTPLSS